MNVRLSDGTVRCGDCFDASSYESQTADPCTYCGSAPIPAKIHTYSVIFSDPTDSTWGMVAQVQAVTAGSAQDECNRAVQDPNRLFDGCDFTIWPEPIDAA